jgi:hypothetical protein
LFLNGQLVTDAWGDPDAVPHSYTRTLTAGTFYNIELHYFEKAGDATCHLQWSYPGQGLQTIPRSQLFPTSSSTPGTGLRGQYYNDNPNGGYPLSDPFAESPVLTRTDATVDFDWNSGSPSSQVNSNSFSARWTGQVKAPVSGSYTFTVRSDDGVRLFINGTGVIDGWSDHCWTDYSYTTTLSAGTLYNIELHYYDHEGEAECQLRWSYPGQSTQIIPSGQLYPSTGP